MAKNDEPQIGDPLGPISRPPTSQPVVSGTGPISREPVKQPTSGTTTKPRKPQRFKPPKAKSVAKEAFAKVLSMPDGSNRRGGNTWK